jgi:predicted adenine nucleotide alpha hydrolase (AANH) superfamily ATPase
MADVQTPEMELKLALLLNGTEIIYCNSSWRKNTNFLRKYSVAQSQLTYFKFEYCTGVIACRGWQERER